MYKCLNLSVYRNRTPWLVIFNVYPLISFNLKRGQKDPKELHWHTQIPGMIVCDRIKNCSIWFRIKWMRKSNCDEQLQVMEKETTSKQTVSKTNSPKSTRALASLSSNHLYYTHPHYTFALHASFLPRHSSYHASTAFSMYCSRWIQRPHAFKYSEHPVIRAWDFKYHLKEQINYFFN
jgi:hypothetical protein